MKAKFKDVIYLDDITGTLGELFSDEKKFDENVPKDVLIKLKEAYIEASDALNTLSSNKEEKEPQEEKEYCVNVTETLSRYVKVLAKSANEAVCKVYDDYHNEDIVLTADDFTEVSIEIVKEIN